MKRSHSILMTVLLVNAFFTAASMACDAVGGGYRLTYRPAIRYAPLQRLLVVRQAAPSIRTVNVGVRSQFNDPAAAARPEIRLAPTQIRTSNQNVPVTVDTNSPSVPTTPSPSPLPSPSTPNPTTVEPVTPNAGEQDALSMLAGGSTPTGTEDVLESAPANGSGNHVGVWQAKASTNATVTLRLNADDSFEWLADNDGQQSRFAGNFELDGSKLVLVRSSDNLKLNGNVTFSGDSFNFKLEGAQDAGLSFSRQQ